MRLAISGAAGVSTAKPAEATAGTEDCSSLRMLLSSHVQACRRTCLQGALSGPPRLQTRPSSRACSSVRISDVERIATATRALVISCVWAKEEGGGAQSLLHTCGNAPLGEDDSAAVVVHAVPLHCVRIGVAAVVAAALQRVEGRSLAGGGLCVPQSLQQGPCRHGLSACRKTLDHANPGMWATCVFS